MYKYSKQTRASPPGVLFLQQTTNRAKAKTDRRAVGLRLKRDGGDPAEIFKIVEVLANLVGGGRMPGAVHLDETGRVLKAYGSAWQTRAQHHHRAPGGVSASQKGTGEEPRALGAPSLGLRALACSYGPSE